MARMVMTSFMSVRIDGTAHAGPSKRLPKDQLPRRVLVRVRRDVSVRTVLNSSDALAPPLCTWGRGQQLRDRWCSALGRCALFDALLWPMHLASSSATGRSTGPCTSGCRRRPCSTCPGFKETFGVTCRWSFVATHTKAWLMLHIFSVFLLLQTPSWAAKLVAAMAVESAFVLTRTSAQPQDTGLLKSSERNLAYTSPYKRKYHALIKEEVDKTNALWLGRALPAQSCQHLDGILTVALQNMTF